MLQEHRGFSLFLPKKDSLKIHLTRFTSRIRLAQVFIDVLRRSLFLPKALDQKLEKHSGALAALAALVSARTEPISPTMIKSV